MRQVFLFLVMLLSLTYGCVNPFAPNLGEVEKGTTAILTERLNPDEVLENFILWHIAPQMNGAAFQSSSGASVIFKGVITLT